MMKSQFVVSPITSPSGSIITCKYSGNTIMVVKHNLAFGRTVLSGKVFFTMSNKLHSVTQIQFLDTL